MLETLTWASFVLSVSGAFLCSHNLPRPRFYGMSLYYVSNVVMMVWSYQTATWGILATQGSFFVLSNYAIYTHWKDR
jgi:hypothetical protein